MVRTRTLRKIHGPLTGLVLPYSDVGMQEQFQIDQPDFPPAQ